MAIRVYHADDSCSPTDAAEVLDQLIARSQASVRRAKDDYETEMRKLVELMRQREKLKDIK